MTEISKARRAIVVATVVVPIALALASLAFDRELWPFATYPMYSNIYGASVGAVRAMGVTRESPAREIALADHVEPAGLRLGTALERLRRRGDESARLVRIACAMGAEHERQRAVGLSAAPAISAVRIYRDNFDLAHDPPTVTTTLLAEGPAP